MQTNFEFAVFIDGVEFRVFHDEKDAQYSVKLYDGEHDIWYEKREAEK